jgi:hypothetical protein
VKLQLDRKTIHGRGGDPNSFQSRDVTIGYVEFLNNSK